jgi:hypothetical protein
MHMLYNILLFIVFYIVLLEAPEAQIVILFTTNFKSQCLTYNMHISLKQ